MMMFGGLLALILFGGVLVALLVGGGALLHNQGGDTTPSGDSRRSTAREVLDQRLARGEISREEYVAIRDQIDA